MKYDRVLMSSAVLWSSMGTCARLSVGCVIADPRGRVISSGYNGAPAGLPHCEHNCDCGHEFESDPNWFHLSDCRYRQPCKVAVHSEDNALKYADVPVIGHQMFCTHSPCMRCAGLIIAAGIGRVVYLEPYRDTTSLKVLSEANISVERYEGSIDALV